MNKPFPAYRGTGFYAFVCYAHMDAERVYADLAELHRNGINLWYDEGIPAGTSWRGEIATAIKGAHKFLFFISQASLNSTHCLREIDYALNHDIEIVPIYLDDSVLPGELELVLNRVHALFRETDSMYLQHLEDALRGTGVLAPLRSSRQRKGGFGLWIMATVIVVFASLLASYVFVWQDHPAQERKTQVEASAPSAYDRYLKGLELMDRWDKDSNLVAATTLFREATKIDPDFALAYARLAEALRVQYILTSDATLLDEANATIQEANRLDSGLSPVQVTLGRLHSINGNIDLASAAFERALAIDPNDAMANEAIGGLYSRLGRLKDAEAAYRKAVSLNPEDLRVRDAYANFLFAQSRFEEAASEWQQVVRLAPDHFAALLNLGTALNATGKSAEAISMYLRAIELRPTYMAYSNLGTAYAQAGHLQKAVEVYQKAIELDDTDWLAWGNLAFVLFWMNGMDSATRESFEHAISLAETARKTSPRDSLIYSDLALYYAKTGDTQKAFERLRTALSLSPDSGEVQAAAAEVFEQTGNREAAMEHARKALESGFPRQELLRNRELAELVQDPRLQNLE